MTTPIIILCAIIALLIAAFAAYLFWAQRKFEELEKVQMQSAEVMTRRILAYERLTLFTERTKLEALISRLYQPEMNVGQMRQSLQAAIKEEFEHNVVQQLYVEANIWEALTRMKDQNIFIINQVASMLPSESPATELNRNILELLEANPNSTLNQMILEAIQFEVKKVMG